MSSLRESWQGPHRLLLLATSLGAAVSLLVSGACSTDVDLGGSPDAANNEAEIFNPELVELCDPCDDKNEVCPSGSKCGRLSGNNEYCAKVCPTGAECSTDEICVFVESLTPGVDIPACLPSGGCPAAASPIVDGAVPEHCGALEAPVVPAACESCEHRDPDCQPNGCYGGWWCSTKTHRCQRPPGACPQ